MAAAVVGAAVAAGWVVVIGSAPAVVVDAACGAVVAALAGARPRAAGAVVASLPPAVAMAMAGAVLATGHLRGGLGRARAGTARVVGVLRLVARAGDILTGPRRGDRRERARRRASRHGQRVARDGQRGGRAPYEERGRGGGQDQEPHRLGVVRAVVAAAVATAAVAAVVVTGVVAGCVVVVAGLAALDLRGAPGAGHALGADVDAGPCAQRREGDALELGARGHLDLQRPAPGVADGERARRAIDGRDAALDVAGGRGARGGRRLGGGGGRRRGAGGGEAASGQGGGCGCDGELGLHGVPPSVDEAHHREWPLSQSPGKGSELVKRRSSGYRRAGRRSCHVRATAAARMSGAVGTKTIAGAAASWW